MSTKISGQNNEVRTSSRSVRKVSYVESDGSEELDEGKKKKPQKVQSSKFFLLFFSFFLNTILDYELLHAGFCLYLIFWFWNWCFFHIEKKALLII